MANYQKIKGTRDFYGDKSIKLAFIENVTRDVAIKYGYGEIVTPIFENTDVFVKNVGEDSDVVNKEMYTFIDKGKRSITLRQEGTAAIVRCFVENKLHSTPGIKKYYYFGPMFRYERPQAGRYREFHQFGVEVFGDSSPFLDAEVILSAYKMTRPSTFLAARPIVCMSDVSERKKPSLSASKIATRAHSGISSPSRSKLIPTKTLNIPLLKSLIIWIRSNVSMSECI